MSLSNGEPTILLAVGVSHHNNSPLLQQYYLSLGRPSESAERREFSRRRRVETRAFLAILFCDSRCVYNILILLRALSKRIVAVIIYRCRWKWRAGKKIIAISVGETNKKKKKRKKSTTMRVYKPAVARAHDDRPTDRLTAVIVAAAA